MGHPINKGCPEIMPGDSYRTAHIMSIREKMKENKRHTLYNIIDIIYHQTHSHYNYRYSILITRFHKKENSN